MSLSAFSQHQSQSFLGYCRLKSLGLTDSITALVPNAKTSVPFSTTHLPWTNTSQTSPELVRKKKTDHVTPLLHHLHWLPVSAWIQYKIDSIRHKCIHISLCLHLYTPSRTLHSKIPHTRLAITGQRPFTSTGPNKWSSLPLSLHSSLTLSTFKTNLKTFLFPL